MGSVRVFESGGVALCVDGGFFRLGLWVVLWGQIGWVAAVFQCFWFEAEL